MAGIEVAKGEGIAETASDSKPAVNALVMPVPLAKKHIGMRVDHSGILGRIANGCKVRQDQRWCLGELDKHLEEMAERFYSGDIQAVDEFLQLWCLDDKRPEA